MTTVESAAALPYRDRALANDERVDDLMSRMTIDEKVAQLGGVVFPDLVVDGALDDGALSAALCDGIGHVARLSTESGAEASETARFANVIQCFLREHTRLGIPALVHEEALAGVCARGASQFPQAIGLASTWNPQLVEEIAKSCRRHLRAVGARVALAPVLDLARDPRWGRLEETYGEDPELVSRLGVAFVRGLQGNDLGDGVAATAKHFVAHGVPAAGFNQGPVQLGPREVRDVMAAPFRAAINEASVAGVMSAYHAVDGVACSASTELLDDLLRGDLGFGGVVVADYWAVSHLETIHHVASNGADSARQAIEAGVDVELPTLDRYRSLPSLVLEGDVDEAIVDRAVRRVLRQKFALGLFDEPMVDERAAMAAFDTPEDRALARRAAAQSLVLLTNDGTLPLDSSKVQRVAVIGPTADDGRLLLGDYHYPAHIEGLVEAQGDAIGPRRVFVPIVTPLEGLRAALPDADIEHVVGAPLTGSAPEADIQAAVALALACDVALLFVGGLSGIVPAASSGELRDTTDLTLPTGQRQLIDAVAATGTPTVVVVISGRAHVLAGVATAANALAVAWLPGEEGGRAIADVITGVTAPSGRLPVSLLQSSGQIGVTSGHLRGGGRSQAWGDYVNEPSAPLFSFGHGLGYTTFEYSDLQVIAGTTSEPMFLFATVTNTGEIGSEEVVQVYARYDVSAIVQPERRLVAFARLLLEPGQSRQIVFDIAAARMGFTGRDGGFVVEPGAVTFFVGASREDIRLTTTIELLGDASYPDPNAVPAFRVTTVA